MKYGVQFHEKSESLILPWYNQHHLVFLKFFSFPPVGPDQKKKLKEGIMPR